MADTNTDMTDTKVDAALRTLAVAKVFQDRLKVIEKEARAVVADALAPGEKASASVDGTPVGTVSKTFDGDPIVEIENPEALDAWALKAGVDLHQRRTWTVRIDDLDRVKKILEGAGLALEDLGRLDVDVAFPDWVATIEGLEDFAADGVVPDGMVVRPGRRGTVRVVQSKAQRKALLELMPEAVRAVEHVLELES